ncbi:twin-arginine translocase subunit TatC [Paenibacillus sp. ACRRX]|uniref:twin-arginine translocase subunit TatC n=1 Tax=unclassified Paenibacillus TaxID=185978 RepID=UPI001EF3D9C7|nr:MULTISPECIES: twin-arginine translocase subunit TatC [unclassified Paenibacillus]MCG7408943.1 twin-arginine translocase subunit TatC [Paenibacillus sp. ACRRX]MDK8182063.1 twin-arginine translocase subunit TatC [Paenibacillus sp. UMB4589-SE434]
MSQSDEQMSIIEHITELRKRIIYVLIVLVVGLVGGFFAADPIYKYLISRPPANGFAFHSFSLWDGVGIYMKIAVIIAIAVTLPCTLYQVWAFVSPGLKPVERRATVKYIPYVFILFLCGLSFAYFVVFPMAFEFTSSINQYLNLKETYGITQYLSFMFNILLPMALLFELPLVIMFLTAIRLLNPIRLRKMRRFAYFILVFLGITLSPPDFISDFLVSVPLLILYEFSVFLSAFIYRKQLARQQEWEQQFEEEQTADASSVS